MRITMLETVILAFAISASSGLYGLQSATPSIPQVDVNERAEMITVSTWRICGPFALSKDDNWTWDSDSFESDALRHDYLEQIGGKESPLSLGAPTTNIKVNFSIDAEESFDSTPLPYKPFIDQIQDFSSGVIKSQVIYWGFPKRFAITYAATQLHTDSNRDVVFVVGSNSPLKIWLNGVVIAEPAPGSTGHNWSDYYILRAKLRSGNNSLLVKMFSYPERNDFSFHIGTPAQADKFVNENATFLDLLDRITVPRNAVLSLSSNLLYLATGASHVAKISIFNTKGNEIHSVKVNIKKTREVPTHGMQDGLYDLQLSIGGKTYSETFYIGDINARLTQYKAYCEKYVAKAGVFNPCVVLQPLLLKMTDSQMTERLYKEKQLILLLSQFEWSLLGVTASTPVLDSAHHVYLESYRSELDGTQQYYFVHLPPDYSHKTSVPLVIICPYYNRHRDYLGDTTRLVALALQQYAFWADKYGYAFIFPNARGVGMSNSIGMKDVQEAIHDAQRKYSIDPSRIYLTGDCTGGRGTFLLAEEEPNRFAAISTSNASTYFQSENGTDSYLHNNHYGDGLYLHIDKLSNTPIRLIHADLYPHSPISQALEFKASCSEHGFNPELIILHGDGVLGLSDPIHLSFEFFKDKHLPLAQ